MDYKERESFSTKGACMRYDEDSVENTSSLDSDHSSCVFSTNDGTERVPFMSPSKVRQSLQRDDSSPLNNLAVFYEHRLAEDDCSTSASYAHSREQSLMDAHNTPAGERGHQRGQACAGISQLSATPNVGLFLCRRKKGDCCVQRSLKQVVNSSFAASDRSVMEIGTSTGPATPLGKAKCADSKKCCEVRKGLAAIYLSVRSRQNHNVSSVVGNKKLCSSCPHNIKRSEDGDIHKHYDTNSKNSDEYEKDTQLRTPIERRTRSCPAHARALSEELSDTEFLRTVSYLAPDTHASTRTSSSVICLKSSLRCHMHGRRQYNLAVRAAKMGRYGMTVKELLANPRSFDDEDDYDGDEEEGEEEEEEEMDDENVEQDEDTGVCEY